MKKITSLVLIIILCLSFIALTACGSKSADTNTFGETTAPSSDGATDETPDEKPSETNSDTDENIDSTENDDTIPPVTGDVIDLESDAMAVYNYVADTLVPDISSYHFEILDNVPGEDGKSCTIDYSFENDKTIHYYQASLELKEDGQWVVKENKHTGDQEK